MRRTIADTVPQPPSSAARPCSPGLCSPSSAASAPLPRGPPPTPRPRTPPTAPLPRRPRPLPVTCSLGMPPRCTPRSRAALPSTLPRYLEPPAASATSLLLHPPCTAPSLCPLPPASSLHPVLAIPPPHPPPNSRDAHPRPVDSDPHLEGRAARCRRPHHLSSALGARGRQGAHAARPTASGSARSR
eukprot:3734235-Rhodomonas_salina.1